MLAKIETSLEWDVGEEEKYGRFRVFSVNLAKILEDEAKETPDNNLKHVLVERLTDLLEKHYPGLSHIDLRIVCRVRERVIKEEEAP